MKYSEPEFRRQRMLYSVIRRPTKGQLYNLRQRQHMDRCHSSHHSYVYQSTVHRLPLNPHQYHQFTDLFITRRLKLLSMLRVLITLAPSLYRVEDHHQQHDGYLKSLNSAIGGNGATREIGGRLDPNGTDTIGQASIHILAKYSEVKRSSYHLESLAECGSTHRLSNTKWSNNWQHFKSTATSIASSLVPPIWVCLKIPWILFFPFPVIALNPSNEMEFATKNEDQLPSLLQKFVLTHV